MKNRLLTFLFLAMAPLAIFAQTFSGDGLGWGGGATGNVFTGTLTVDGIAPTTVPATACTAETPLDATAGVNYSVELLFGDLSHTWAADLQITLTSPNGTVIDVMDDVGGSDDFNNAALCFDFNSTMDVSGLDPTAVPADCFAFQGGVSVPVYTCGANTGAFQGPGEAVNGDWTLDISDTVGGDGGSFGWWNIVVTETPILADDLTALACCAEMCELDFTEETIINLEAGECEEVFPGLGGVGLTGGASCVICETVIPDFAVTVDDVPEGIIVTDDDADGVPESVLFGEASNLNSTLQVTATNGGVVVSFDYMTEDTDFDEFIITGPNGIILFSDQTPPLSGSESVLLLQGEFLTFTCTNSGFDTGDDFRALITNFAFAAGNFPCYEIVTDGPVAGDFLGEGTFETTIIASFFDAMGNPDPSRDVSGVSTTTVNAFSGPVVTSLACNDAVNISVDEACSVQIGADMFLEGGPYACYDDYIVNIFPFGNEGASTGDVNAQTVDFSNLLGTHTYEVIDPVTGNSCWGEFTIEDKLAPTVMCDDYTINCTQTIINSPAIEDFSSFTILENTLNAGDNTYTLNIPQGFTISDLNVNVDLVITGDEFGWGATITSPAGDELSIWPLGIGGCGTGIDFIADDQGPEGLTCAQFQSGTPSSTFNLFTDFGFPYTPLSAVNGTTATGTWTLNLSGDVDVNDITLLFNNGLGLIAAGDVAEDACGNTTFTFSDASVDNGCDGEIISRTWFATDASGNVSESCVQTITIESIGIADILLPPAVVSLDCGVGTSPEEIAMFFDDPLTTDRDLSATCTLDVIENNEGIAFAYPHFFQVGCDGAEHAQAVDNSVCNIFATYEDQVLDACGVGCNGNEKVIRTWTLLDWCTSETATFTQLINAVDETAPTFSLPNNPTYSTNPWDCVASFDLPTVWELKDNCDAAPTYTVSGPAGVAIVGDVSTGFTAIGAPKGEHTFTYTAYDCCGNTSSQDLVITIFDGAPPVAIATQNIVVSLSSSATNNQGLAKLFAPSVDNGSHDGCTDVQIEIRRDIDLCDVRGNDTYNADGHPDDGSPNPTSPSFDPDGGQFVTFCCDDITASVVDVNGDGVNDEGYHRVWLRVFDDGDMDGVFGSDGDNFNETWVYVKVEDKLAPQIVCPPDVTLMCDMDYTDISLTGEASGFGSCGARDVVFNDIIVNLNTCNEGFVRRRWSIDGNPGVFCDQTITLEDRDEPVTVSFSQVGDIVAPGCPDVSTGSPTWIAGPCDVLGYTVETDTFLFEDGACLKIINEYTVINWCDYDPSDPNTEGIWEHTQVISVTDETQPELDECVDLMFNTNDFLDADGDGNTCEGNIVLTRTATDPGSDNCPTAWLKWQVVIDIWGDGTDDLEYSSFLPAFDSQFNDTNGNGIPDVYVAPTAPGDEISIALNDIPGSMSNHKVTWTVSDGCNNVRSCSHNFMVVDKKAPTPYCISVSTATMQTGQDGNASVELWATDFNIGSFDNCTAQENLRFSFSGDEIVPNRVFDCDDVANSPVQVDMWVWDEKDNRDFCTVFLTVIDNTGQCPGTGSRFDIAGTVTTETGTTVSDVNVTLDANITEFPVSETTEDNGSYLFDFNPEGVNYEVTASRDVDYLNGVSTLDLVKIQRHILGLESLDSPYKLVAADINANNNIQANDLSQLRRLILGVISELPDNESWRFIDAAQSLDMNVDLADVDFVIDIADLSSDMMDNDLVAVKIGDVTGNAQANLNNANIEVRSSKTLDFVIEGQEVIAGETVEVTFSSENFEDVYGYQFTMELNGLEFASVQNGAVAMSDANVGVLNSDLVTVSYSNGTATTAGSAEGVFTATFVATKDGNIANMIDVTSKVTQAEAYIGEVLEVRDVTITTREDITVVESAELFQNEPNPFNGVTTISFNLVEKADATITITDVTGKSIITKSVDGVKGYNSVTISSSVLGVSGFYFYTVESGEFTATKKMMLME